MSFWSQPFSSRYDMNSESLPLTEMPRCLAGKKPADSERERERDSSKLYVCVYWAPAGRREINACALVLHEVRRRLDRRRRLICATGVGEVPLGVRLEQRPGKRGKRAGENHGSTCAPFIEHRGKKDGGEEMLCINGSIWTFSAAARFWLPQKVPGRTEAFSNADITCFNSITSSADSE